MIATAKRAVPQPLRTAILAIWRRMQHAFYTRKYFGKHAALVPPLHRMFDGTASYRAFKENGEEFLRHYIELANLRPDAHILDVGAGIGRKTLPLLEYLGPAGRYEGIEIVPAGVAWCQARITPRYPQFHFRQIDVYNRYYNPSGTIKASEYRFPFPDNTFDFVVLGSVFTHLQPDDMANYVGEIARVLKPGGRCMATCFLLNPESRSLIAAGHSTLDLRHGPGAYMLLDPAMPERAIGYDEHDLRRLYERHGLAIRAPIQYGSWCGRERFLSYQDIVVAVKSAPQ